MNWVYILECEDDHFYVGETCRLYSRFWEHRRGGGGVNTQVYPPVDTIAIYKVSTLSKFLEYDDIVSSNKCNIYNNRAEDILTNFADEDTYGSDEYDHLYVENHITESLMTYSRDWTKVRGGKYTRFDVLYQHPQTTPQIPACKCGLPCDIKKNEEHDYLYFRCAKKNMWSKMKDIFDIETEPCTFFMRYTKDIEYNKNYNKVKTQINDLIRKSGWLENLVGRRDDFCIGGCGKPYNGDNTIRFFKKSINLCYDCFIDKNVELANKYNYNKLFNQGKCQININDL